MKMIMMMMMMIIGSRREKGVSLVEWLAVLFPLIGSGWALDNGLALTPPMGWMSWQRFKCDVDCRLHPKGCISEELVKRTVRAMASEGFLAAGYEYVAIDDCWLTRDRDENGLLQPDPLR